MTTWNKSRKTTILFAVKKYSEISSYFLLWLCQCKNMDAHCKKIAVNFTNFKNGYSIITLITFTV